MSTLSQYSDLTYLIELIALGLVAAALLVVTISIMTRLKSGKREQKKMLSLRRSAEKDKQAIDVTLAEIDSIGKQIQSDATETNEYLDRAAAKVYEAEQHAETVANIEIDMKQLVDGTTERMAHIQEYWEQLLTETKESMSQVNTNLESLTERTDKHSLVQTDTTTQEGLSLNENINGEIKETLELTLKESNELLSQIKDYQLQAKTAFAAFTQTLGGFESQAHEQFDEIFNTADMARQELNANLDESRKYMKIFRKDTDDNMAVIDNKKKHKLVLKGIDTTTDKKATKKVSQEKDDSHHNSTPKVKVRPVISVNDAEELTNPSLVNADYANNEDTNDNDKNLISLFTKFKHHGS